MSDWIEKLMNGDTAETIEIPHDLGEVTRLANALITAQDEVKAAEAVLETQKARLRAIQERALPDALISLGITGLPLASGRTIKLKDYVNASIASEFKHEAFQWLRENGHDDIIKNIVSVTFGKGQDQLAEDFVEFVRGWNQLSEVDLEQKPQVHSQTLVKFVKDQMAEGISLPEELFSIHTGTKVEIK